MKGTPQFVMCGNSDRALRALREAGAPVTAVDVLPDPAIRQELSAAVGLADDSAGLRQGRARRRRGHHRGAGGERRAGGDARGAARRRTTATAPRSTSSTWSAARAPSVRYADPAPADRRERAGGDQRCLERLAARPAQPAVEVRHPFERTLVVALAKPVEHDAVRMEVRVLRAPRRRSTRAPSAGEPAAASIRYWPSYQSCAASSIRSPANSSTISSGASAASLSSPSPSGWMWWRTRPATTASNSSLDVPVVAVAVARPGRRARVDAERVVARLDERGHDAAHVSAADVEHPRRSRQAGAIERSP